MSDQLLSTDPAAGLLSTDPAAGLRPTEPKAPQPTPTLSGGVGGFLSEATQGLNPRNINAAIQAAFWHPIETGKGLLTAQDVPRQEALTSFQQGDYVTGTRKLIDWMIPILGPRLDEAADYLQQGQIARGLGATTDVGVAMATPQIVRGVTARLPTRAGMAAGVERAAEQAIVDVIAPKVGPEKIRFGVQAARVAGDVARRTTARTVGGLLDEAGERAAASYQALDQAYAAIPQPMPTQPILAAIDAAINQLTVRGAGGAAVHPELRAPRLAALRQARAEVVRLGPQASPAQLRQLRIAWDEGAEAVFTPRTADNFRAVRQEGHGWADARTALNDTIVGRHRELAPLNADATLWTTLRDVLQATEEIERVRPRVGRSLMARGLGAATGAAAGGPLAAGFGAIIAPTIESAMAGATPTAKLLLARQLMRFADALHGGQPGAVRQAITQVSLHLPRADRAAFTAQALRLMRDLEPARGLAAEVEAEAPVAGPSPSPGRE